MLRKIRIIVALICFILITLLFLDFTGTLHVWLGWMAKVQFLPTVLVLNLGVIVLWVVLTLLLGRIYCSVICPLGVMQDIVSYLGGRSKPRRFRFSYSPAKSWLRYGVLVLFIIAMVAGAGLLVALLEPYSAYGRIVSNLFAPICGWSNNLLANIAGRAGSYALYRTDVWMKSLPTLIIAALTLVVLAVLAWRNGRTYCNTICPVGTVLGLLSRISLFRPTIDTDKCNDCGLCSRQCKAACIDSKAHQIDYSRCVVCMDCIGSCHHKAIKFRSHLTISPTTSQRSEPLASQTRPAEISRRSFLTIMAMLVTAVTVKAQKRRVDGAVGVVERKKIPKRATPIVPPGALSVQNFGRHCTGCQLCVTVCPNQVLRPSSQMTRLLQPELSYERGYCHPECTSCSEVCPSGAIRPIDQTEKSATQIGHAVWISENCIILAHGARCGSCARHCPIGAIEMVPINPRDDHSPWIPAVNTKHCIGCGACENSCPARPFSAIYVEGNSVHHTV